MAENQDNKDIEYMTNKSDQEDIDVIFNDDDKVKIVIPSEDELKDFPEKREEDYISDDDLDFVDSFESFGKQTDNYVLNLDGNDDDNEIIEIVETPEPQNIAIDDLSHLDEIKIDFDKNNDSFTDKLNVPYDADLFFPEHKISEGKEMSENEALGIPDLPENKMDMAVNNVEEAKEDEPSIVINLDEPDLALNTNYEENKPDLVINDEKEPEISSEKTQANDADRIEIVVKDFEQEVILPEVSDTPENTLEEPSQISSEEIKQEVNEPELVINPDTISEVSEAEPVITSDTISEVSEPELVINPSDDDKIEFSSEMKVDVQEELKKKFPEVVFDDEVKAEPELVIKDEVKDTGIVFEEEVKSEPELVIEDDVKDTGIVFEEEVKPEPELVIKDEVKDTDIVFVDTCKDEIPEADNETAVNEVSKEEVSPEETPIIIPDDDKDSVSIPIDSSDDFSIVEAIEEIETSENKVSDEVSETKQEPALISDEDVVIEEPKSEDEELLEDNVLAVSSITASKGFYFAKKDKNFALYGYINDEIFELKEFYELYDENLGYRLEERTRQAESYIVKVNSLKLLVEVTKTSMSVVMEF